MGEVTGAGLVGKENGDVVVAEAAGLQVRDDAVGE
jgi:hypothetical protein